MAETDVPETSAKIGRPEYTIKQVHDVIPPHCFCPSTLLSVAYILNDAALVACLAWVAVTEFPGIQNQYLRTAAWTAYSFCQGLVFTGLWELAHECGHGALSKKKWVNDALGLVIHSFLLVPYHSWRLTHSTHHKTTNNIEKDIAFVPDVKDDYLAKRNARNWFMKTLELVEDMPIMVLLELIGHQLVAFPTYLLINNFALPRMAATPWWKRSHFYFGGDGPNFKPRDRDDIILSNLGIVLFVSMLWAATQVFGGWNVMKIYGFPYLWTNHWIRKRPISAPAVLTLPVTITFLQHCDISLPYYSNKSWTFVRGSASAIDRSFGIIGHHFFHGATEAHVLHHHASRIPFYHAVEASEAMQTIMGAHYQSDFETPYLWAFWKIRRQCRWVEKREEDHEIYFYPTTT
jgi:fatty acid desaturase